MTRLYPIQISGTITGSTERIIEADTAGEALALFNERMTDPDYRQEVLSSMAIDGEIVARHTSTGTPLG